jgi:hypothetical protein
VTESYDLDDEEKYLTRLDSLASSYNAEVLAHIGYELTLFSVAAGSLLATANPLWAPFVGALIDLWTRPNVPFAWWTVAFALLWVFLAILAVMWFFGCFHIPYSFKYLLGRSQYYLAMSEIIWAHMGVAVTPALYASLRERVTRLGGGQRHAIQKLFEAQLYLSNYGIKVSKGGRKDDSAVAKNLVSYFGIGVNEIAEDGKFCENPIISLTDQYYNKVILMLWKRADLLTLAYEPTFRDYETSHDPALNNIAKLIRDC